VAQKFHFAILRIEVTRASRGLSAIAELLVKLMKLTSSVALTDVFWQRYSAENDDNGLQRQCICVAWRG